MPLRNRHLLGLRFTFAKFTLHVCVLWVLIPPLRETPLLGSSAPVDCSGFFSLLCFVREPYPMDYSFSLLFDRLKQLYQIGHRNTLYGVLITGVLQGVLVSLIGVLIFVLRLPLLFLMTSESEAMYVIGNIASLGVSALSSILIWIVCAFIMFMAVQITIRYLDNEGGEITSLLKEAWSDIFKNHRSHIAFYFVVSSLSLVGFVFFIVPGIVLVAVSNLAIFYCVDEKISYIESWKKAWGTFSSNLVTNGLFIIVCSVIATLVSTFTCFVGSVLAFPFSALAVGIIYGTVVKKPVFDAPAVAG